MPRTGEEEFPLKRLHELALRAARTGSVCFTPFLTPPEAEAARVAARKEEAGLCLFGGYEDAERQMAGFGGAGLEPRTADFPMQTLEICWPRQSAPQHRDLLGSVMGLGIKRQCLGDIVLWEDRAYLFAESAVAPHVAANLTQAGRNALRVAVVESPGQLAAPVGREVRDTVPSLRLDALVASGLHLSREKAAALITSGHVKLRHGLTLKTDARVEPGDMISVRGMGRLQLTAVGQPTRKDRLPVTLMCFGIHR